MRKRLAIIVFAALPLAACEQPKSVEYYIAHLPEARETLARCQSLGKAGENCGNAGVAITRAARAQFERDRARTQENIESGAIWPTWNGK